MKQGRLGVPWYGVVWHHVGTKNRKLLGRRRGKRPTPAGGRLVDRAGDATTRLRHRLPPQVAIGEQAEEAGAEQAHGGGLGNDLDLCASIPAHVVKGHGRTNELGAPLTVVLIELGNIDLS